MRKKYSVDFIEGIVIVKFENGRLILSADKAPLCDGVCIKRGNVIYFKNELPIIFRTIKPVQLSYLTNSILKGYSFYINDVMCREVVRDLTPPEGG